MQELIINPVTRIIEIPKSNNVLGVYHDNNVDGAKFTISGDIVRDKLKNASDIYVNYIPYGSDESLRYKVKDRAVSGDEISFSWILDRAATNNIGNIVFIVCFKFTDGSEWNTTVATGKILEGIEPTLTEEEEKKLQTFYDQLIQQLRNEAGNGQDKNVYAGKTIVAFGDSIIAGWGWQEGTGITQPLKEKYTSATWINNAESGANMAVTSSPTHTPIVKQITSYTGAADAIILNGGVNDKNNGISIGSIASDYDATYDTSTFCGAMESALQHIMDRYPQAVKLYLIPHSFGKDNSLLDSIYEKAVEICRKWNMPYLDMRTYGQIAMTANNKDKYTYNPNSQKGDGVHPNETWYRTFYCPVIDRTLQNLGIGSIAATEEPDVVSVTGVKLDQSALTLNVGESVQLTATILPSNATVKNVTWSSSNSNIIVSNGKVTGNATGSGTITVTTTDGGYTATCDVTIQETVSEEHTELGSITLDGSGYFDTEIYPNQDTNTEIKWYVQNGTNYIFGARDDKYKYGYTVTDNFYAVRGTVSSAAKTASAFWEDDWLVKQTGTKFEFNSNAVNTAAIASFTLTSPCYIGNMSKNKATAGLGLKGKIYYAKIYSGSELAADMVPVKKSDGTLCLYDKVRKKYLYKKGVGTLTE